MDLETKLREMMDRHAPSPTLRPMPAGTASRIIRRRVAVIASTMAVAVAFVVGAAGLFRYLSAGSTVQRPAAEATVAMPSPTEPGVTYITPAPFADLAPGQWPDAEVGGVENPYVDRESGVELDKTVVASGIVEGTEWSMTSFAMHGGGACGELFLGDWGDYGGVRFCSHVASEPGQTDLRIAARASDSGPSRPTRELFPARSVALCTRRPTDRADRWTSFERLSGWTRGRSSSSCRSMPRADLWRSPATDHV
jgi:hypothetical protein